MRCICASLLALALCGCGFKATSEGGSSGSTSGSGASSGATSSSGTTTASSGTNSTSGATSTTSGATTSTTGTTSTASSTTSTGSTTSTTSTSSTSGTSGSQNSGDCSSNSDCPNSSCVEVTPGGFRQCVVPPQPPETCTTNGYDQCCPDGSLSCPNNEACILGPATPYCGGVMMQSGNVCAADQCTSDADCAQGSLCAPAGTLGVQVRACVYASCRLDTDCTAQAGGKCEPVADACCGTVYGLYCVYPGGCRSNADCPSGYCTTDGTSSSCHAGTPACPM